MLFELVVLGAGAAAAPLPEPPPKPEEAVEVAAVAEDEGHADSEPLLPDPGWPGGARDRAGLLLRFSIGPTYLWGHYEGKLDALAAVSHRADIEGGAFSAEMVFAGAPAPGFALGARMAMTTAPEPALRAGSEAKTFELLHLVQGGFIVDWYLVADGGFHVFASTGLAMMPAAEPLYHELLSGIAWSGGVGYELWLSQEWSAGITLRVDGAYLVPDSTTAPDDPSFFFASPSAQLSFTYD